MASREDILIELKLTPTWRRREAFGESGRVSVELLDESGRVSVEPLDESDRVSVEPLTRAPQPVSGSEEADLRRARIAALTWQEFASDVDACVACGLCKSRKRSVPGVGDLNADWLLVGEAPGAEEDARGEPFVGQAGKLLDNMLRALELARGKQVYIANVLKCRPPNNRTPEPHEAQACRPYLERQIELLRPRLIVALGRSAAAWLLGTDATIASLRGRVHDFRGLPLIVTYHPAYLLRTLPDKAKAWEDLLLARRTVAASAGAQPTVAASGAQPLV